MKAPLKLNSIDQEHLQELYNSAGVARDELPYSPAFDNLVQGFQDRTFKNAEPEQVFGAIVKYVRSSSNASARSRFGEACSAAVSRRSAPGADSAAGRVAVGGHLVRRRACGRAPEPSPTR